MPPKASAKKRAITRRPKLRGGSTLGPSDPLDPLDAECKGVNPMDGQPWSAERKEWAGKWKNFPVYGQDALGRLLASMETNSVTIIKSATGSGKTVLTPALLLAVRKCRRVAVTTPKRMTTLSAAQTATKTLDAQLGKGIGVEYRGADREFRTNGTLTRVAYLTDGTLLSKSRRDPTLAEYDAVVVDEAHERPVPTDLLLLALRNALAARKELHLVVMSATIDTGPFQRYFEANGLKAGVVEVAGGTQQPIERRYLPADLASPDAYLQAAVETALAIANDPASLPGDILVFVPTVRDAENGCRAFNDTCNPRPPGAGPPSGAKDAGSKSAAEKKPLTPKRGGAAAAAKPPASAKAVVVPAKAAAGSSQPLKCKATMCASLYSKLSNKRKDLALLPAPEPYERKVVFATNIAESSVTLEGLTHVIDTGLELGSTWDPLAHGTVLTKRKATQSQVQQRVGRVGRTAPGVAHLLYTEVDLKAREEFPAPSITTIDFTDYVLQRLAGGDTAAAVRKYFGQLLTPPTKEQLDSAEHFLGHHALLDSAGKVTRLGATVQSVADELRISTAGALVVVAGVAFGCVEQAAKLAAVLEADLTSLWAGASPRDLLPAGTVHPTSDHATLAFAFDVARETRDAGDAAGTPGQTMRDGGFNIDTWRNVHDSFSQWQAGLPALAESVQKAFGAAEKKNARFVAIAATDATPLVRAVLLARSYHAVVQGKTVGPLTSVELTLDPAFAVAPPAPDAQARYEEAVHSGGQWSASLVTWVPGQASKSVAAKSVAAKVGGRGRRPR